MRAGSGDLGAGLILSKARDREQAHGAAERSQWENRSKKSPAEAGLVFAEISAMRVIVSVWWLGASLPAESSLSARLPLGCVE